MSNILAERIKQASLTKTQMRIADFFLKNQKRLGNLSSLDVSTEIGVSDASIIRFSRAIGFDGFSDLKDHIYNSLVEESNSSMSLTERLSINKEKYEGGDLKLQFRMLMLRNIEAAFNDNSDEDFDKAADHIARARNRYVVGMRGCKGIATQFGRLLSFMVPGVHTLIDTECTSVSTLQDATEDDVLIMFIFSRFYKIDKEYLRLMRERNAKIILVTNDITTRLCGYADVILTVAADNMSFFHSTLSADMVGELILNLVATKVQFEDRIKERDAITEYQRL